MICRFVQTKEYSLFLACDKKLLGKTLKENGVEVELKKEAYGDKEVSEKEFVKLLHLASNINLFGEKCVNLALKNGVIKENDVKKFDNVAHVQIYRL